MPFLKTPKRTEPLAKIWNEKAQKCGLRHTVYSVNGDQYTGVWLDNKKHGTGTQVWKRAGLLYDGDWRRGERDGRGTLSRWHTDEKEYKKVYHGGWKNNKMDGFGTYFYTRSSYYEGGWKEGRRSGWGRMQYESGDVYQGQWLQDQENGQGMLCLANKNRYEGGWKDGKRDGHGKFFFLDRGQLYEGFWVDGVAKCGTVSDFGRDEAPQPGTYPIPELLKCVPCRTSMKSLTTVVPTAGTSQISVDTAST
uniref:MORN repeat-containing protein 3 n=1 Tax=Denticeps clupeoides TaxID=299321 RepID=A0AAY4ATE9_9TELE